MAWKIKEERIILDEKNQMVGMVDKDYDPKAIALIKYAPDMHLAILEFCMSVETTSAPRNPKRHYEEFQRILERISEYERDLL